MSDFGATGYSNICGCIGPIYGEPYCPCKMRQLNLPRSEEYIKETERLNSPETFERLNNFLKNKSNDNKS